MSVSLKNDLTHFCEVYQNRVDDILRRLPPDIAAPLKKRLDEEFDLFRASMLNRIKEET